MAKVAHQILDVIARANIKCVFGIPGGLVIPLFDALMDRPELDFVMTKHEENAVFMAMGYALATGRPGVAVTTAGPGTTNAFTGLASAKLDGVPLLHIAGEVPLSCFGHRCFQNSSPQGINVPGMVRDITKFSAQIVTPEAAAPTIHHALETSTNGVPGPVFISIPIDVASAEIQPTIIAGGDKTSFETDEGACLEAAGILKSAKRPLIIAGAGCRSDASREALATFAHALDVPVTVTPKGKGVFPEDSPNYLGVMGFGGHDSVIDYLKHGIDVLFAVGTTLNDFATNAWTKLLAPSAALVQVDIDAEHFVRAYHVNMGIIGRAEVILERIRSSLGSEIVKRDLNLHGYALNARQSEDHERINMIQAMECLNDVAPRDAVFVVDIGEHLSVAVHYLRVGRRQNFYTSLGFGSVGSAIGISIGHQIGAPRRRTYAICGDGGFSMNGSDLTTAVDHGANVTFLVMNDNRYGMVHHGMTAQFGRSPGFSTRVIDFAMMARSVGAEGVVINTAAELGRALRQTITGPLVLDIRIDPNVRLLGNQRAAALSHFASRS